MPVGDMDYSSPTRFIERLAEAKSVMLNKGVFATGTIDLLTHILNDMHSLFKKKRSCLSERGFGGFKKAQTMKITRTMGVGP